MNHRTDSYGGSVENRSRFGIELYEAMRHAVGSDFALGIRLIIDEAQDGGIDFEDGIALARQFQQGGCVDFFNAIYGRMDTVLALAEDNMPGMASPDAPFLMRAGQFKAAVQLPVFHAARIADVATARYAIKEGLLDLVGMTRAHIAEPYIAAKIANGIEDRIRPCVGATHCMGKNRPSCIHNPATGREAQLRHVIDPSPTPRRVVIIGAGPAGLEAARVCGARGHDVTVLEAAPHPGGQVLLAARASWRRSLTGIIDWRIAELAHLGVQIRCNVLAEEDDITALAPDLIIVATGGIPNSGGLPGEEHITSPWDILDGTVPPEGDVLVVDGTGRHVALSVAERVLTSGSRLQMAVIDDTLAAEQGYAEKVIWRKWARLKGIRPLFEEALIGVRRDGNALIATLRSELTGSDTDIRCAQVIWDYGTRPMDALFHGLRMQSRNEGVTDQSAMVAGQPQPRGQYNGFELHRIGDAVASRNIHAAILDALRLCQHC
jgi:thioredoxin reductase